MITTVLIDIDNTLLDFNECARASVKQAFLDMGIEYDSNVFSVFTEINSSLWKALEEERIAKSELHRVRWQIIFDRLNIKKSGSECEEIFLNYLKKSHYPVPGAISLLKYLNSKYTVCAASNSAYEQQKDRLTGAGMIKYIDYLFISERIGFSKPTKEFFDACFYALGDISKHEVIMIGDSLNADIRGGNEYGIKTCWYNYNREAAHENIHADYVVESLHEIKRIL